MAGARLASAPTTPLPRATATRGGPPTLAEEPPRRSVLSGLLLWLIIVGTVFGGGGFYAYKQGLIFAKTNDPVSDSTLARDTATLPTDSTAVAAADTAKRPVDTSRTTTVRPPPPSGPPGRLVLQGVPQGARISIGGEQVRGTQLDLPSGVHRLSVRAAGYHTYDRQVTITPGETFTMRVDMQSSGDDRVGPCDQFGPAYNQDNLCFDSRPVPLSSTLMPVPADAPVFPRQAILLIKVSRDGTTLEARVFVASNVDTFNNEALDMAKNLRWNPAQKNGEPVESWVQWRFQPVRQ